MPKNGKPLARKKKRGRGSKTNPLTVLALQREQQALTLRIGGASYRAIGEALGMGESGAAKAVYRALDKLRAEIRETADQYVQLQLERLDKMLLGVWTDACQGRYGAIDRVLRIEERRARLLGLDAAQEMIIDWRRKLEEHEIPASEVFEELVQLIMARMNVQKPE